MVLPVGDESMYDAGQKAASSEGGDAAVLSERVDTLASVLAAVRHSGGITQPQLVERVGIGRTVVGQRVDELQRAGLVEVAGVAPSTGGRAPKLLRLRADAGLILGVDIHATGFTVGVAELDGRIRGSADERIDVSEGPQVVLDRVEAVATKLLDEFGDAIPVWGVGVGVPGPVEFATGLPVAPPIMPGWDGYDVRARLSSRFGAPVWVDNDVNVMALGELRGRPEHEVEDMLYVKIGTGIGAGLVSGGQLHRGANGCAGDIGHVFVPEAENVVCRCGNLGCLESIAGGAALVTEGRRIAESGGSAILADILANAGQITINDIATAASRGDAAARALLGRAGLVVGATLATLVSFYNPEIVVLGGGVVNAGDHVLASIREAVYRRSLPLATRTLRIEPSRLGAGAALSGATQLALDELFASDQLERWLPAGSPAALLTGVAPTRH